MKSLACFTISLALGAILLAAHTPAQRAQSAEAQLGHALHQEEVEGNLEAAVAMYKKILADFPDSRPVAARALLQMGRCYEKLGQDQARNAYERLLREYGDQNDAGPGAIGRSA
jgi:tetratricopeptide (TPR) repeat protein